MLNILLAATNEGEYAMSNVVQGIYTLVLGMVVIFLGITIIITVVTIIGKLIKGSSNKPVAKQSETTQQPQEFVEQGLSPEVKAAIIAAISAIYFSESSQCEFKIKKIKRI